MGSQPLDTDQHRQDASRGGSSSGGSPGHKKAKPQGAAELPQGGVSGLEQGGGVEEAEGAALRCQADHGERSLCKTLDVEQDDLQPTLLDRRVIFAFSIGFQIFFIMRVFTCGSS